MRKILILCGRYLPGYKDGGPVRSIKNLTERLGDEYDFRILTTDRDHGDTMAYSGIQYDAWNEVGKAKVWYVQPGGFTAELVEKLASEADVVYLCGCFNDYARVALRLKKEGRIHAKTVIASMGLFSPGAFKIKRLKKQLYITVMKATGQFRNVVWSATNEEEIQDIRRVIGKNAICKIAQDLPAQVEYDAVPAAKDETGLKVIFLSRISRKKNLSYALEILSQIKGKVQFDVYGAMEDEEYYSECLQRAAKLPDNVTYNYKGEVNPQNIYDTFSGYHVFLFPTLGENYGHVIYEALVGGCIPIISDRAPWQILADKKLGYVIPLEKQGEYITVLNRLAEAENNYLSQRQRECAAFAAEYARTVECDGYKAIFNL